MSVQLIPVDQRKARRFIPQQKLQILKEWELTGNGVEVAQKHQIHPMTLYRWGKAVQQGNSGGPLLNESGNVIGIIVSKLNASLIQKVTGDIPQNINFAIKDSIAKMISNAHNVHYVMTEDNKKLSTKEIGSKAAKFILKLQCWN